MYKAVFIAAILFVIAAVVLNNNFEQFEHNNAVFVYDAGSEKALGTQPVANGDTARAGTPAQPSDGF